MTLSTGDVVHLLIALSLLILLAHATAHVFSLLRQPPVVGEIAGGLLLGPTVLGVFAPEFASWLFPADGVTASVLGAVYELGLLLLMFLVGMELEFRAEPGERRTVALITITGLIMPFAVGIAVASLLNSERFTGPQGSPVTFGAVFGVAIAVTSIPVISRILMDLGILDTAFARIVLSVAVLEDIVLYVILAVVLGLAQAESEDVYGLWALVETDSTSLTAAYYVTVSLIFLTCALTLGARVVRTLTESRFNIVEQRNPAAFRLLILFGMTLSCVGLGINPIFGALTAGVVCARADASPNESVTRARSAAWASLRQFSLAFFIPGYFAIVGLKLDLVRNVDIVFMCWFFVLACVVKTISVWTGARLAGEAGRPAINLAVALNARGGPGIVLATVTFSAGIINEEFFTALILLSIFTSQLAGYWLDHTFVRRHDPEQSRTADAKAAK